MVVRDPDPPSRFSSRKLLQFRRDGTGWLARNALYTSPRAVTPIQRGPNRLQALTPRPSKDSRLVSPMRELERDSLPSPLSAAPPVVVGGGRVGASLSKAAALVGIAVQLLGHDEEIVR